MDELKSKIIEELGELRTPDGKTVLISGFLDDMWYGGYDKCLEHIYKEDLAQAVYNLCTVLSIEDVLKTIDSERNRAIHRYSKEDTGV